MNGRDTIMRQKVAIYLILLFSFGLLIGCGSDRQAVSGQNPDKIEDATPSQEPGKQPGDAGKSGNASSGRPDTMQGFLEEWNRTYKLHEKAVNAYEGMPVIDIFTVPLPLTSGPMYEILNMENKDGRHEGKLALSGLQAFIEKNGTKSVFGYDTLREQDGSGPNSKAGDRLVENGIFEADKGYFKTENQVERDGNTVDKTVAEYLRSPGGVFAAMYQYGSEFDARGDERKSTTAVFLLMGEKQYRFVVAKGEAGAAFQETALKDGMTAEEAEDLLAKAGYRIQSTGGVQDGVFTVATP